MVVRPVAVSGLALTAAMIAVAPTVVTPREVAVAPPVVHIEELQLAGIGQDVYQAITNVVQQVVGGVSYVVNFTPIIGAPIAAQININYFQGIQPVVEATVNYAASVVQNPLNFIGNTGNYGSTLYDIGYNYVSAQLQFIGLAPLPPIASGAASVRKTRTPGSAAALRGATETESKPGPAAERTTLRPARGALRDGDVRQRTARAATAPGSAKPSASRSAAQDSRAQNSATGRTSPAI